jgi:hypothetical protein
VAWLPTFAYVSPTNGMVGGAADGRFGGRYGADHRQATPGSTRSGARRQALRVHGCRLRGQYVAALGWGSAGRLFAKIPRSSGATEPGRRAAFCAPRAPTGRRGRGPDARDVPDVTEEVVIGFTDWIERHRLLPEISAGEGKIVPRFSRTRDRKAEDRRSARSQNGARDSYRRRAALPRWAGARIPRQVSVSRRPASRSSRSAG